MKLTLEVEGTTVSIEEKNLHAEVWATVHMLRQLLTTVGFSTEEIEEGLGESPKG